MGTAYRTMEFSDKDKDLEARLSAALNRRAGLSIMPHHFAYDVVTGLYLVRDVETGARIEAYLFPHAKRRMVTVVAFSRGNR